MWSQTWASLIVTSVLFSFPVSAQQAEVWSGLVADTKDGKGTHPVPGIAVVVIDALEYLHTLADARARKTRLGRSNPLGFNRAIGGLP